MQLDGHLLDCSIQVTGFVESNISVFDEFLNFANQICGHDFVFLFCVKTNNPEADATIVISACNHRQCRKSNWCNHHNGIVAFFLLPLLYRMRINQAGEPWGQSWYKSMKSRCIREGLCVLWSENILAHFPRRDHEDDGWRLWLLFVIHQHLFMLFLT